MKTQIYPPCSPEKQRELSRNAARIRIMCVDRYLQQFSCTAETKIRLIHDLLTRIQQK